MALEIQNSLLLLADRKARRTAIQLGLKVLGTMGLLIEAKQHGIISEVLPHIERLTHAGLRLSKELIEETLREAGEL